MEIVKKLRTKLQESEENAAKSQSETEKAKEKAHKAITLLQALQRKMEDLK